MNRGRELHIKKIIGNNNYNNHEIEHAISCFNQLSYFQLQLLKLISFTFCYHFWIFNTFN